MHIVVDARILGSTTGVVAERMLHHLQDIDGRNRYTVLVNGDGDACWAPRAANFAKLRVDVPHHSLAEQFGLRRVIDGLAPDLVHFCAPQQPLLLRGRRVTTFHDLTILRTPNPRTPRWRSLAKRAVGWAAFRAAARLNDRLAAPSAYTKADLVDHLGVAPDKVAVVHNAAEVARGPTEPMALPFGRFILHVGRQPAYKNVAALCDAHQRLLATRPDLGLVLVGRIDDEVEATRRRCEERGYRNVLFTGFLPDPRRDWLYAAAQAYVFPSLMEGFGLPGLEAMAHDLPVVSSDATCLPEIYGDAARYFDARSVDDMAAAIAAVLDDRALRDRLIDAGRRNLARFSWRRMAEEMLAVYEDVGAAARPAAARPAGA